ncbi:general secretion pathway protein GspB [Hydrogenophaga luteola]|uniref:General secretion pathway protein GspB n=1 Tax=Hydrogenophaga luteola TaxID=1591122 RepID=A0ABV7W1Q4_9BURK
MSYILDALKRADAERERGHVPGLHSQGTPPPAVGATRSQRISLPLVAGAFALLLAAATVVWWWNRGPDEAPAPGAAEQAPANVVEKSGAAAEVATAPPAPALPILAPPQVAAPPPAPRSATAPAMAAPAPPAAPPVAPAPAAPSASAGADRLPPPAAAAPASAPAVKVSGVTYSSNASHRMLIANGKVVREGEEIEPGLKVEVISPRSAILNHRGSRYNINY